MEAAGPAQNAPQPGRVRPDLSGPGPLYQLCGRQLVRGPGGETVGGADTGSAFARASAKIWGKNRVRQ